MQPAHRAWRIKPDSSQSLSFLSEVDPMDTTSPIDLAIMRDPSATQRTTAVKERF